MRNAIRLAAAGVLAALMTFSFGAPAQAYPDPTITIELSGDEFVGGLTFDFEVSSGATPCDWTVSYPEAVGGPADQTATGTTSISGTYDTKPVTTRTPTTITATCEYDPADVPQPRGGGATAEVSAADTASASATVYLLPTATGDGDADGGDDNGGLPGTGGSSLWILIAGAALVVVGGGAVALSRRSH